MTETTAARAPEPQPSVRLGHASGFEFGRPLPPALLYRRCDPAELPFALVQRARGGAGADRPGAGRRGAALRPAHARQGLQCLRPRGGRHRPAQHGRGPAAPEGGGRADPARLVLRQQFRRSAAAPPPAIAAGPRRRACGGDEAAGRGIARRAAGRLRARRIPGPPRGDRAAVQAAQRAGLRRGAAAGRGARTSP